MPKVRKKTKVIAILISDIHLSDKAPIARIDDDWFKAMANPLKQVRSLSKRYDCPVICAGDIFHNAITASPELINFALRNLPTGMLSIYGQHDLYYHNPDHLNKSAYQILMQAGKIHHLSPAPHLLQKYPRVYVYGFGWNYPLDKIPEFTRWKDAIHIAVLHKYLWIGNNKYTGAKQQDHVEQIAKVFKNFDVLHSGDNHKGFFEVINGLEVANCGALMRRNIDEKDYQPTVGLVYDTGEVIPWVLDTSKDKLADKLEMPDMLSPEESKFIKDLESIDLNGLDFVQALKVYLKSTEVGERVSAIIEKALEGKNG